MEMVCIKGGQWFRPSGKVVEGPSFGEEITVIDAKVKDDELYYIFSEYPEDNKYNSKWFVKKSELDNRLNELLEPLKETV